MSLSSGGALLWSAALHALGFGIAGWATHGRSEEQSSPSALQTTRAYALQYLIPARPEPAPPREPARARSIVRAREATSRRGVPGTTAHPVRRLEPPPFSLSTQELTPGEVEGIRELVARPRPAPAPVTRGLDRGATLVTGAGSACPALPSSRASGRSFAVSVALVVDSTGRVDPAALRVIESPAQAPSRRSYFPRIYVVGARLKQPSARIDPRVYDAVVTGTVTSHIVGLTFHPAMKNGRPVSSTVLIACHHSSEG